MPVLLLSCLARLAASQPPQLTRPLVVPITLPLLPAHLLTTRPQYLSARAKDDPLRLSNGTTLQTGQGDTCNPVHTWNPRALLGPDRKDTGLGKSEERETIKVVGVQACTCHASHILEKGSNNKLLRLRLHGWEHTRTGASDGGGLETT
eukprot:5308859-Pleurochrysis_carterae.AAC.2